MLSIWHKPYTIRRFSPEGRSKKFTLKMNVQPSKANDHLTEEPGDRSVKYLVSFGRNEVLAADENNETLADRLLYMGLWYECLSSVYWSHTPLKHHKAEWVLLPPKEQTTYSVESELRAIMNFGTNKFEESFFELPTGEVVPAYIQDKVENRGG